MKLFKFPDHLLKKFNLPHIDNPIEKVSAPSRITLPAVPLDRSGAPHILRVETGDVVSIGQKLSEVSDGVSSFVYSPISGTVVSIDSFRYIEGGRVPSITIQSDGKERKTTTNVVRHPDDIKTVYDYIGFLLETGLFKLSMTARDIFTIRALQDDKEHRPIETLIINGIEEDLSINIESALLVQEYNSIKKGLELLKQIFQPDKTILVVEDDDKLKKLLPSTGLTDIAEIVYLKNEYPISYPQLLINKITNKIIPVSEVSFLKYGLIVEPPSFLVALGEVIETKLPILNVYLTVSGESISEPKNLKVRIGTSLKRVIDFCGGFKDNVGKIVLGGPMKGIAQYTLEAPILEKDKALWVQKGSQVVKDGYRGCFGCGKCVSVCPIGLMPNLLGRMCEFGQFEDARDRYYLFECLECGLCEYVCPARRPLVHFFKFGKLELKRRQEQEIHDESDHV